MFQKPPESGPWWEEAIFLFLGCTWPFWLLVIAWLVLGITSRDYMGGS